MQYTVLQNNKSFAMSKAIQDNDKLYNALSPLVQFGTKCHYQCIDVHGIENLPSDGSYIIAPCHQQALMEPLAILTLSPKPPVFLARADIFQKPAIRAFLTFLKIMPVYRIRDGQSNLSKNNDIFDRSRDVLLDGFPLCLMAEGRHNNRHHLLPLSKGMFRIAGETQTMLGETPLYIVPTGIDFEEYERPYSCVVVNIGKPIPIQPFMEKFRENEPVALNEMRNALTEALIPLMHDIRNEKLYEEIYTLSRTLTPQSLAIEHKRNNAWNRFLTRQKISQQLDRWTASETPDTDVMSVIEQTRQYKEECKALKISELTLPEHWNMPFTLLALLALMAFCWLIVAVPMARWILFFLLICYPITFIPTHLIVKKLIADPQFRSSVNYGVRLFLTPIYTLIITVVIACTGGLWMNHVANIGGLWALVALTVIPFEIRLAAPTVNVLKAILRNLRFWWLKIVRQKKMSQLGKTFKEILFRYNKLNGRE